MEVFEMSGCRTAQKLLPDLKAANERISVQDDQLKEVYRITNELDEAQAENKRMYKARQLLRDAVADKQRTIDRQDKIILEQAATIRELRNNPQVLSSHVFEKENLALKAQLEEANLQIAELKETVAKKQCEMNVINADRERTREQLHGVVRKNHSLLEQRDKNYSATQVYQMQETIATQKHKINKLTGILYHKDNRIQNLVEQSERGMDAELQRENEKLSQQVSDMCEAMRRINRITQEPL